MMVLVGEGTAPTASYMAAARQTRWPLSFSSSSATATQTRHTKLSEHLQIRYKLLREQKTAALGGAENKDRTVVLSCA